MSKTDNHKVIIPVLQKLEVDDNWSVEIPFDLRDKFSPNQTKWVDVYFSFANEDDLFDALIDALIHEGTLIVPNPE
ncbi:MAG: hypothetical protein PHP26_08460 [Syntrophomonas sp.]|jgi:hypothetical protein|uniref:hypothetical protein n=1 Tax=Syntrophomonas TaxID=862 RepID=UPI0007743C15|nr:MULTISPECIES: hypothetical protein [Syntrophomonas]MDD3880007.1 hypothetical protein [Syntrophomonas sp.]MDD4625594.1 hypothetical protein [Syntrophomonas sp.]